MRVSFQKMQGCGNDFLLVDSIRSHSRKYTAPEVRFYCDRHFGVGADGLVVLKKGETTDVEWDFYNSDGSEAEMCGNAARCVVRYVSERYLPDEVVSIQTRAGVVRGRLLPDKKVEVTLSEKNFEFVYAEHILEIDQNVYQLFCTNTGVPHAVLEVKDLTTFPVARVGRSIQQHALFRKEGTNVTFFQRLVANRILSTTFERGVCAETYACGTGAAAAGLVFSRVYAEALPINISVPGGELTIDLSPVSKVLLLTGPAEYVFEVELESAPVHFEPPRTYHETRGGLT